MMLRSQMEKIINGSYKNIGGLIVLKEGKKVYESYRKGYTENSYFHVFSVTKSIVSLLIGTAIDQKLIRGVDQKLSDFFHEYETHKMYLDQISLKDLLTMTAPFKESKENYRAFFASDDWVKASLERLDGKKKAGRFYYAALIGPDILTGLLANCTHEHVIDYARKQLFEPLGIAMNKSIQFASEKEQLDWYNEKMRESGWVAGPTGVNTGGWGLVLKTNDMAKIGQLYLQKGSWEGKQIVSKEWIEESTSKKSRFDEMGYDYGYLWWLIDEEEQSFAALGDGGNVIYVNPAKQLVVAIGAEFVPKTADAITLIKQFIEPVFAG